MTFSTTIVWNHRHIVILDILDRIRLGVFDVVTIVPPCSTWSRARHKETEGQKPLRSRSCPLGLPALSLSEQRKVDQANECLELGVWLAQQALSCETKQTDLLLVAPEDFGGEAIHGPAAIWQFKELHDLGAFNEAQPAAGFLCQLSKADQKRPLGFILTLPTFRELLHSGWPQLDLIGDTLQYSGPLPKDCPCATTHKPMVGLSEGKFWSSTSPTLGQQFWHTYWTAFFKKPFSLREGGLVQKVSNSEGYPLAARSGSWHSLLCLWKNGGLNRTILRDWADTSQVDPYFDTCISSSPASSTRSRLEQRCSGWSCLASVPTFSCAARLRGWVCGHYESAPGSSGAHVARLLCSPAPPADCGTSQCCQVVVSPC